MVLCLAVPFEITSSWEKKKSKSVTLEQVFLAIPSLEA